MGKIKTFIVAILCISLCSSATGDGCIVDSAVSQIGVEEKGQNEGEQVGQYLETTGLGTGYPWCAAFVNWLHHHCGFDSPEAKAAWSPAWFPNDKTVWQRGSVQGVTVRPGDVFGIHFSSKDRIAHVGVIHNVTDKYFITIEGNTNGAGSREGDGVYRKRRPKRSIYKISRWQKKICQNIRQYTPDCLSYG